MPALLEAESIGRRDAGGAWLLRDLSLSIHGGERIAIQGPSGSGKTLLLRALALLDPLDAGTVRLSGRPVAPAATPRYRRRVGYLHQTPALIEGSVEANLRLPFTLSGHRRRRYDRDRAVELLARLGRGAGLLTRGRGELSGGETQIVALTRLLQLEPHVLLLDEPTSAMDPDAAGRAVELVGAWQVEGGDRRAYLWVTHDEALAARVARRRLSLDRGALEDAR